MFGSRAFLRPLAGLVLVALQLVTAAAASALESRGNSGAPAAHIEAADQSDCPPPHNETLCRLCQIGTGRLPPAGPGALLVAATARAAVAPAPRTSPARFTGHGVGAPRAPPPPPA